MLSLCPKGLAPHPSPQCYSKKFSPPPAQYPPCPRESEVHVQGLYPLCLTSGDLQITGWQGAGGLLLNSDHSFPVVSLFPEARQPSCLEASRSALWFPYVSGLAFYLSLTLHFSC